MLSETASSRELDRIFLSEEESDRLAIDRLYERIRVQDLWKYRKLRRRPGRELSLFIAEATGGRVTVEGWSEEISPAATQSDGAAA